MKASRAISGGPWRGLVRARAIPLRGVRTLLSRIFKNAEAGVALDYADLTDEKIAWRRNLLAETEFRNGITDAGSRGGTGITGALLAPYAGSIAFIKDSGGSYAYKQMQFVAGVRYWISTIVKMDDGLAPAFGSGDASAASNDFVLVMRGDAINPTSYGIVALGDGFFQISATLVASTTAFSNAGIVKYGTNSTRNFKATAYHVNRGPVLLPYQALTDVSTELLAAFPAHSLFQDYIGTLAVFDREQPISVAFDTRLGGLRLAEKTVNGDFSGAVTAGVPAGWTSVGGATATVSGGIVTIGPLSNSGGLSQDIAVTPNAWVEVRIVARRVAGTGDVVVWASHAASYANSRPVAGANFVEYSWRVNSPTGVVRAYLQAITGDGVLAVKSVSTREIPGNHAVQATTGDRPVMSGRWNLLGSSEAINVGPWAKVAGLTVADYAFTGPDGVQLSTLTGVAATTAYAQQQNIVVQPNVSCVISCHMKQGSAPSSLVRVYTGNVSASIVGVIVNWSNGVPSTGSLIGTWSVQPSLEPTSVAGVYRLVGQFSSGANTSLAVILYPSAANQAETTLFGGVQLTAGAAPWRYQRTGTLANDYDLVGFPRGARFNGVNTWMQIPTLDLSSSDKVQVGVSFRKEADPTTAVDCALVEMGSIYTAAGRFVLASSVGGATAAGFYVRGSTANTGSASAILPGSAAVLTGAVDWSADTPARVLRINAQAAGGSPATGAGAVGGTTQTGASATAYLGRRAGTGTAFNGMIFRVDVRTTAWDLFLGQVDKWLQEPMKAIS